MTSDETIEMAARVLFLSDRGDTLPAGFAERQWDEGYAVKDDYIRRARALAEAGLLASLTEWDVEYRSYDGYVSRHTDDVFDETDLGYEQAKEYADAYNDLDSSPGVAVVVRRYVTGWEEA